MENKSNSIIGIGIVFVDVVIASDFETKNHSYASTIHYEMGGSICNMIDFCDCDKKGLIYKKGNDFLAQYCLKQIQSKNINPYPIEVEKPTPIFTIINQKQRYTSLTHHFDFFNVPLDCSMCNNYEYGVMNCHQSDLINYVLANTTCKWVINSYLPKDIMYERLEGCIMNREEASMYGQDMEKLLKDIANKKVKWAIITLDKEGCIGMYNHEIRYFSVQQNTLSSRIRCGDLFSANVLSNLMKKVPFFECIEIAMAEVESFLKQNKTSKN